LFNSLFINLFFFDSVCIIIPKHQKFSVFNKNINLALDLNSSLLFNFYSKFFDLDKHIQVGEYCFRYYVSLFDIIKKIKNSDREIHKFILIDGWTYDEVINHLNTISLLNTENSLHPSLVFNQFSENKENNLEGLFYPSTYYYSYPETSATILQKAHDLMANKLQLLYKNPEVQSLYKSEYELLIVASIIEKEASDALEQRIISGIIQNRLKHHMKLQIDATVMYGVYKNYTQSLKKEDMKINTLYNTYLHKGLPPTPISMPGESALFAAAYPEKTDFLYYVSKKDGKHQFSISYEDHIKAIKKYLKEQ
jgi:UPF0755 protein